jgi:hypothetical protein
MILTYADDVTLPDDGRRYELRGGELSVTLTPGTRHQMVSVNLFMVLRPHVNGNRLGQPLSVPVDGIAASSRCTRSGRKEVASRRVWQVMSRPRFSPSAT